MKALQYPTTYLFILIAAIIYTSPIRAVVEINKFSGSIGHQTYQYRIGGLIITYKKGINELQRQGVRNKINVLRHQKISPISKNTEVVDMPTIVSVNAAVSTLSQDPKVAYVEPDYIVSAQYVSDDIYYLSNNLWGMYGATTSPSNIYGTQASLAWGAGYIGSNDIIVGIVDQGIDLQHEELASNIFINPNEIPDNGLDDDLNGYIDDVNGWNFNTNTNYIPADFHGTHVAGTIGAMGGNALGVAGVNWQVKIIPAVFLNPQGYGSISNAVKAIDYLTTMKLKGFNIIASNNSWGGGGYSQALLDAIRRAQSADVLFVAAAGNSRLNIDITPDYPCGYAIANMICVAAITSTGALASYSNYGVTRVQLGAPGSNILSTLPNNTYGVYSGTSMATPHVTGALALCESKEKPVPTVCTKSNIPAPSSLYAYNYSTYIYLRFRDNSNSEAYFQIYRSVYDSVAKTWSEPVGLLPLVGASSGIGKTLYFREYYLPKGIYRYQIKALAGDDCQCTKSDVLRKIILSNTVPTTSLSSKTSSKGRLNVYGAVNSNFSYYTSTAKAECDSSLSVNSNQVTRK